LQKSCPGGGAVLDVLVVELRLVSALAVAVGGAFIVVLSFIVLLVIVLVNGFVVVVVVAVVSFCAKVNVAKQTMQNTRAAISQRWRKMRGVRNDNFAI
jgi:hypothetical protein